MRKSPGSPERTTPAPSRGEGSGRLEPREPLTGPFGIAPGPGEDLNGRRSDGYGAAIGRVAPGPGPGGGHPGTRRPGPADACGRGRARSDESVGVLEPVEPDLLDR